MEAVIYIYIHGGWALDDPLISALCLVVFHSDGLHLLYKEPSLMRAGSYTYPGKLTHKPLFDNCLVYLLVCFLRQGLTV